MIRGVPQPVAGNTELAVQHPIVVVLLGRYEHAIDEITAWTRGASDPHSGSRALQQRYVTGDTL